MNVVFRGAGVLAEATEKEKRKKEERMRVAKATSSTTETTFPQESTSQSYSWVDIPNVVGSVATGKPERQARKASHCGSKQR